MNVIQPLRSGDTGTADTTGAPSLTFTEPSLIDACMDFASALSPLELGVLALIDSVEKDGNLGLEVRLLTEQQFWIGYDLCHMGLVNICTGLSQRLLFQATVYGREMLQHKAP